jgi:hypothetical protein
MSTWTPEAIRALGVTTDLPTLGKIFRISRTRAYQMGAYRGMGAGRHPHRPARQQVRRRRPVGPRTPRPRRRRARDGTHVPSGRPPRTGSAATASRPGPGQVTKDAE